MTDRGLSVTMVAVRLWESAASACEDPHDTTEVIDALLARLEARLRRWIGAEGYAALLSRAVSDVVGSHPALAAIPDLGVSPAGVAEPVVGNGSRPADEHRSALARRDAIIALLCTMMQQLGGIIGDPMAMRLFEQTITPSQRGVAGVETNESSP